MFRPAAQIQNGFDPHRLVPDEPVMRRLVRPPDTRRDLVQIGPVIAQDGEVLVVIMAQGAATLIRVGQIERGRLGRGPPRLKVVRRSWLTLPETSPLARG